MDYCSRCRFTEEEHHISQLLISQTYSPSRMDSLRACLAEGGYTQEPTQIIPEQPETWSDNADKVLNDILSEPEEMVVITHYEEPEVKDLNILASYKSILRAK